MVARFGSQAGAEAYAVQHRDNHDLGRDVHYRLFGSRRG
jgi:hypothetical protein